MDKNDYNSLIDRFKNLNSTNQDKFLKELFVGEYFKSYIECKVNNAKNMLGEEFNDEEKIKYKNELEKKVNTAVDLIIKDLDSKDEELKCRIFERFIDNYSEISYRIKKDICGYNHQFSNWEEIDGKVPNYDEDANIDGYHSGKYFERICSYCGFTEKAYDEEHKACIEKEDEYLKNYLGKKQRYITKNNH